MKTYTSIVINRFTCQETKKAYENNMIFIANEERTEQVLKANKKNPHIRIVKVENILNSVNYP